MPLPTLVLRAPSHAQLSLTPLRRATIVQPWIKIAPDLSTACRSRWTSWVLPEPTTARLWPRLDTTNSSPDVEIGTRVLQLLLVSSWLLFRFLRQRLAELPGTDLAIFVQIRFLKLLVLHLLLLLVALDLNFFCLSCLPCLSYLFVLFSFSAYCSGSPLSYLLSVFSAYYSWSSLSYLLSVCVSAYCPCLPSPSPSQHWLSRSAPQPRSAAQHGLGRGGGRGPAPPRGRGRPPPSRSPRRG